VTDGGTVPVNCEYPWEDVAKQVVVPAEHDFRLDLRSAKAAVTMIKEVRARAIALSGDAAA